MHGKSKTSENGRCVKPASESFPEEVWLLGQPPLTDYLDFMAEMAIGAGATRAELVDEWRAANDYYGKLEQREAGIADAIEVGDLVPQLQPLVDEVAADPRFRRTFDTVPTRFAMVELDRLIVGHPYLSHHHCRHIAAALSAQPTPEALFRFCLPLDRREAPVSVRKTGPGTYLFWSDSSDFRHQETVLLDPGQLSDYQPIGTIGGIAGVLLGYGSNFLTAIEFEDRLLLHNGHHRAHALRAVGITHAPCVIQTVTRRDELEAVASRRVVDDPAFYFRASRPPLLKDFFDPKIRKVVPVHRMANIVEVRIEVRELKKTISLDAII